MGEEPEGARRVAAVATVTSSDHGRSGWQEFRGDLHRVSRQGDLLTIRRSPDWFWCLRWDTFLGAVKTRAEAEKLCDSGKPLPVVSEEKEMKKFNFKWGPHRKGVSVATEIPDGETFQTRVEETSKSTSGKIRYYSHRNGRVIGTSDTLEAAKKLCCEGVRRKEDVESRRRVEIYVESHAGDLDEFEKLSDSEKRAVKWLHPKAAPKEATYSKLKLDPVTGEHKPGGIMDFRPMKKLRTPKAPKEPRAKKEKVEIDLDLTIRRLKNTNPKKAGSDAHERWEFLFKYAGRTVEDYKLAKGNMTTLSNAVKMGYVEIK